MQLAPPFAAISAVMSVPFRYNGPAKTRLDEMVAEPLISTDGAVTGHENTAVLPMPSRSTFVASARLNVPVAGLIRAHVSWLNCSTEVEPSNGCFELKAAVSPVTLSMLTVVVDAAAFWLS